MSLLRPLEVGEGHAEEEGEEEVHEHTTVEAPVDGGHEGDTHAEV